MSMNAPDQTPKGVRLTPEQVRKRRARNLAIGLSLGFLCVLFYYVTMAKLGLGVLKGGM